MKQEMLLITTFLHRFNQNSRKLILLMMHNHCVGMKINYRLSTRRHTTSTLSYTVLEDDISYEKLSSKLVEAETQGLITNDNI